MSSKAMWSTARTVAAGDTVIVWMTRDALEALIITPGKELNGRYGFYKHDDLVGVPYGSKVSSKNGRGFIHILRPTPELWTLALPHRTQILYIADISLITTWLNIKPGCVVVEAGTGSGSFSHSTARTIGPTGHLHTFEYHEERATKARREFEEHGMSNIVSLNHRNVCKEGFNLENEADAVFLDLPAPWEAIPYAKIALKKSRTTRICCFSPCMEQVLRTVTALNDAGFTSITMYETLLRPQEVSNPPVLPSIDTAVEHLKQEEQDAEERRLRQKASSLRRNEELKRKREAGTGVTATIQKVSAVQSPSHGTKRKREAKEGSEEQAAGEDLDIVMDDVEESETTTLPTKKSRTDAKTSAPQLQPPPIDQDLLSTSLPADALSSKIISQIAPALLESAAHPLISSSASPAPQTLTPGTASIRPFPEVRGHTSYLTFAIILPYEYTLEKGLVTSVSKE